MPRKKKYTQREREFRCYRCGELFPNSDLVSVRVNTGSSRGRQYYNDRLLCRPCRKNHYVSGCVTGIIGVMLIPFFLAFVFGSHNKQPRSGSVSQPQNSLQRNK